MASMPVSVADAQSIMQLSLQPCLEEARGAVARLEQLSAAVRGWQAQPHTWVPLSQAGDLSRGELYLLGDLLGRKCIAYRGDGGAWVREMGDDLFSGSIDPGQWVCLPRRTATPEVPREPLTLESLLVWGGHPALEIGGQ